MTAPETKTRTEWAVRFPDGHREDLYLQPGAARPFVPQWMREKQLAVEHREAVTTYGPWVADQQDGGRS